MTVTPLLHSLLRRVFFLPYAIYIPSICLLCVSFASIFLICSSCFYLFMCPFLAKMSFADYFPAFFFSDRVPGWFWFGSVYLVTTAGFVADQLMR